MKAFMKEFKEFIARGNVMDMAVGIIIGGAFTAIVTSLVNDIIMPLISLITGGFDFKSLSVTLGSGDGAATLNYGAFITAIINFLLIALVIFIMIKSINKLSRKKKEEPEATTKECPYCKSEIAIEATKCPHCTSELLIEEKAE
ncbi:MAG: large-conductance mechanosensitive channel protein MscL [Lachnospiraceae bacterium]|nr:large-conductance mechanosensitive channel protein MscL [Lachnospiraceae bacterium]